MTKLRTKHERGVEGMLSRRRFLKALGLMAAAVVATPKAFFAPRPPYAPITVEQARTLFAEWWAADFDRQLADNYLGPFIGPGNLIDTRRGKDKITIGTAYRPFSRIGAGGDDDLNLTEEMSPYITIRYPSASRP